MTTEEFFKFAAGQLGFNDYSSINKLSRDDEEKTLRKLCPVPFKADIILDFLCDVAYKSFYRAEKTSGDVLFFDMGIKDLAYSAEHLEYFEVPLDGVSYWNDIESAAVCCTEISSCSGAIEYIFITEDGRFYNDKHRLIANSREELFDYFASVEYDYRRPIHERTLEFLSAAGWKRKDPVDVSKLYKTFCANGITLTEKQLAVIQEFSGFRISLTNSHEKIKSMSNVFQIDFLSVDRLISEDPQYDKVIRRPSCGYVNRNVIRIGELYFDMNFYLDSEGILLDNRYYPMGHTLMECIDHLFDYVPANAWLENAADLSVK